MKLEIWMIVGTGFALAVGFGVVSVLLLGLHSEVRHLSKLAEVAQRLLAANLRQALPSVGPAPAETRAPARPQPAEERNGGKAPPLAMLAAAMAAAEPPPIIGASLAADLAAGLNWNPDRRLLVMRLASRGQKPEQIAAALRIPEDQVEQFLAANQLLPKK